jgi:hypothetical protein
MALPADGEQIDVSLPVEFQSEVRARLNRLAEGSGPQLTVVVVDVQRLIASRAGEVRHVEIELVVWVFAAIRRYCSAVAPPTGT